MRRKRTGTPDHTRDSHSATKRERDVDTAKLKAGGVLTGGRLGPLQGGPRAKAKCGAGRAKRGGNSRSRFVGRSERGAGAIIATSAINMSKSPNRSPRNSLTEIVARARSSSGDYEKTGDDSFKERVTPRVTSAAEDQPDKNIVVQVASVRVGSGMGRETAPTVVKPHRRGFFSRLYHDLVDALDAVADLVDDYVEDDTPTQKAAAQAQPERRSEVADRATTTHQVAVTVA